MIELKSSDTKFKYKCTVIVFQYTKIIAHYLISIKINIKIVGFNHN